jgi:hypothetical protein
MLHCRNHQVSLENSPSQLIPSQLTPYIHYSLKNTNFSQWVMIETPPFLFFLKKVYNCHRARLMCNPIETQTWEPLGMPYCNFTYWAIRTPTNYLSWLVNSSIPWHNHFLNNLGLEHTTTLGLLKSFSTSFLPQSYYYVLALIVLEVHSLNALSGDNWEICHLSSWEVCSTSIKR